jgi:hypothetical protein
MPTERLPLQRPPRGRLTASQEQELWLGPSPYWGSLFTDEEHVRAAWLQHRTRLLELFGSHGRRPLAWWSFEAPIKHPGYDRERSTLYEAGLLAEAERAELLRYWHGQFDRARAPDFFCCMAPGRILHGEAARRAHFEWADIPRPLVEAWNAERPSDARGSCHVEAARPE